VIEVKYTNRILIFIAVLLSWSALFAGNTGKIAGRIIDKQTGEALAGVNVFIKGASLGAATAEDGFYYILQIPPGKYEIEASYIGYHTITVKEVRVQVDLTTTINLEMETQAITAPTIEVVAEQPLVQKDITSTRRSTSRETIESTPGIENTTDIFKLQGGSFVDAGPQSISLMDGTQLQVRDESIKNIHVRGGRGGEILYMVDGMPVTHPLYGGRNVLELNVVDVEEIELLTGAFSAEYGQAQSGVVNITTRSGGEEYQGGVEYKTDAWDIIGDSYGFQYSSFYIGGPELITRNLLPQMGLKLPGKMNFFISGNGNLSNTTYNNNRTRDDMPLFGLDFKEKQDNSGNFNAKLNWKLTNQFKIIFSYHGSWKRWSRFSWLWKNHPDHMADYLRNTHNFGLRFNHTVSKSTFYNINIGYMAVDYKSSLNDKKPYESWTFYSDSLDTIGCDYYTWEKEHSTKPYGEDHIESPTTDLSGFYDNLGYENIWRDDITRSFTFKGDVTSQIHPEHLIKTGLEIQYHDIQYIDIQDGGTKLSYYGDWKYGDGKETPRPPGPFPEFGKSRWVFNTYPLIGGFFIQDKFEKESLIINAGVRFDWFMPGNSVFKKPYKRQWESATGLKADWDKINYKFSPRFGISFPISVKTVVFFSYGHFNQLPELQFYYRDPYSGGFTGNPGLDYEQTILYEFGLTHQIAMNWAIDIKSYNKDISNQVGTTHLLAAAGVSVDLYDNKGYSRARGIEFEINKRYANFTSGKLTYTIQWATGYSSSAFEDYVRSTTNFPNPIRERPVSWDIRHQVVFQGTLSSPKNKHISLFGWSAPDNWNITMLSKFSSGQPYTPGTNDPAEAQKKEYTENCPPTMTTDLKIKKSFDISGIDFSFHIDIYNIFNQQNAQLAYGFNRWTGKPYKYGDMNSQSQDQREYYNWYSMYYLRDPRQLSTGRYAKFGLSINW
jgi:outer membrane receptor protein involved in Fe transport